jgi:hypothetical protein
MAGARSTDDISMLTKRHKAYVGERIRRHHFAFVVIISLDGAHHAKDSGSLEAS